jgi:hypothetical protein
MVALVLVAGCQNVVGPFARRSPARVDDPLLPIGEQKRLGRERLALPEENTNIVPQAITRPNGPGFDNSQSPGR